MECIFCGTKKNVDLFFVEKVECSHCTETITINYYVCRTCGVMWKTADGKLLTESTVFPDIDEEELMIKEELEQILNDQNVINNLEDFLKKIEDPPKSMKDMAHNCIMCNKPAYEVGPSFYRCSSCGFEWGKV